MSLLIFEPAKPKRSGTKKPLKFILGIGALVGTIALGSTLAASINLNDSGPVEFGQGVAQTVACSGDDSITVTPTSQFINSDGAGGYYFTSVNLSGIPSECLGVDFTITAYDQAGESIVLTTNNCHLPGAGDKPVVNFAGSESATTAQSYGEMFSFVTQSDATSFTLTWVDSYVNGCRSAALAEDVYRITIESGDPQEAGEAEPVFEWSQQFGSFNWGGIASSSNGAKLAAVVRSGNIWTSSNSGVDWTEQLDSGERDWSKIASSSDGAKLVAVVDVGYIYTSDDSGVTWTERIGAGSRSWVDVASSSDGVKLVAVADSNSGSIWTSNDSGATWTERIDAGTRDWRGVASSSNGEKLVAVARNSLIYTSVDSGATWTGQGSSGSRYWRFVTSSSDGARLTASELDDGYLYTSDDSGATWTKQISAGGIYFRYTESSSDGRYLVGNNDDDVVIQSSDYGVTWTEVINRPPSSSWSGFALSSDGSKVAAVIDGGYIWTGIRN